MMEEWEELKCNLPSVEGRTSGDCAKLTEVRHVAHVSEAIRIIEDGEIRPNIVEDESKLKESRYSVVWISANQWYNGSFYGTVEFVFNWQDLVRDKKIFLVEKINYGRKAYRFLLTNRDLSDDTNLTPYDPKSDSGPLRESKGIWFWNDDFTSEFMMEEKISLENCIESQVRQKFSDFGEIWD